eukprot:40693-Rhodomonas_salina.1
MPSSWTSPSLEGWPVDEGARQRQRRAVVEIVAAQPPQPQAPSQRPCHSLQPAPAPPRPTVPLCARSSVRRLGQEQRSAARLVLSPASSLLHGGAAGCRATCVLQRKEAVHGSVMLQIEGAAGGCWVAVRAQRNA